MRHCYNEDVQTYQTEGENLGLLLIEAAGLLASHDGYANVDTAYNWEDGGYLVTVYLHG